ncbi:MAG TPA: hypothetical protein VI032_16305 [Burkholderiaceae bacterium]
MSTETIQVVVPAPVATPRGAAWAAAMVDWLLRLGRSGTTMSGPSDQAAQADGSTHRRMTPTLISVIGGSIWRALKRAGRRRAARELMARAAWHEPFDPGLARCLREAALFDTE